MGESELVLDGMTIEEAMRILGGGTRGGASAPRPMRTAEQTSVAVTTDRELRVDEPATSSREINDSQLGDWRAALRATGAAPDSMARKSTPTNPDATPPIVPVSYAVPAFESLDNIAKHIATCTKCPLYSTALNPVPGEGNPNADFMCVGEAPGATEDETGRPFVGAAGQLLTKILEAIGLRREDVFIVNVLKHRPPGNSRHLVRDLSLRLTLRASVQKLRARHDRIDQSGDAMSVSGEPAVHSLDQRLVREQQRAAQGVYQQLPGEVIQKIFLAVRPDVRL
jgi:DNA polymerase